MKETMKEIMTLAWQVVREKGCTISRALKIAWTNFRLKARMRSDVVTFYYLKVDGTLRRAAGTLRLDMIPSRTEGNGNRRQSEAAQVYYDTEKSAWRSFRKSNLIGIS